MHQANHGNFMQFHQEKALEPNDTLTLVSSEASGSADSRPVRFRLDAETAKTPVLVEGTDEVRAA